ncbi:MAG: PKD domain-containing protein, partial [Candidatus Rokuibacteriota bacterium]
AWSSVGEAGMAQRSEDISGVIQEIVTRPGWASGNALALIITGTGKRVAEPYEGTVAGAPLLHVEYDPFLLANGAPVVNAGADQTLVHPVEAVLNGTVTDDGRPNPPGFTTASWSQVSGPGLVSFFDSTLPATTASFSVPGSYVLRLTAQDGERSSFDELTVVANPPGLVVIGVRVNAGANDAEERVNGTVSNNNADLEMVNNTEGGVTGNQTVGLRFTGVAIPPNATIWSAWVQFQADETNSEATTLVIRGQADDSALAFTSANLDLSTRPLTVATASWSPAAWSSVGQAGLAQRSADLSAVIREIVTRSGWTSGNALALIITGTGKRVAEPYEGTVAGAPLLHVEYIPAN